MEWEPVFILGVTGGVLLVSTIRNVIDTGRRDRPAASPRPAPAGRECARDLEELGDRIATLEWIAAPAVRAAANEKGLRRGAA